MNTEIRHKAKCTPDMVALCVRREHKSRVAQMMRTRSSHDPESQVGLGICRTPFIQTSWAEVLVGRLKARLGWLCCGLSSSLAMAHGPSSSMGLPASKHMPDHCRGAQTQLC